MRPLTVAALALGVFVASCHPALAQDRPDNVFTGGPQRPSVDECAVYIAKDSLGLIEDPTLADRVSCTTLLLRAFGG